MLSSFIANWGYSLSGMFSGNIILEKRNFDSNTSFIDERDIIISMDTFIPQIIIFASFVQKLGMSSPF